VADLIYSMIASLDCFVEDEHGRFDWAMPSDEVHAFVNEQQRAFGIHLYGRRLYEVLAVWETDPSIAEQSEVMRDFAETWQAADKVVYSSTLASPVTRRTRIERAFDPAAVRELKSRAERDLLIGGPHLAAEALRAGLVDECRLFVVPVVVGRGKRAFAEDLRLDLELVEERRFANGTVYLRYRTA
jgi:dihydrofolate reductase